MGRNEGMGARRDGAAQVGGSTGSAARRGAVRYGVALFAAALLAVNWLGWAVHGRRAAVTAEGAVQPSGADGARRGPAAGAMPAAPNPLGLAAVLPTTDVAAAARLSVRFDAPVVETAGPFVAGPLHAAPFRLLARRPGGALQPRADAGHFVLAAPDCVELVLAAPLPRGLELELEPTAALELLAGRPVAPTMRPRWTTGALGVTRLELRSKDLATVTVALTFDAPVVAETLAAVAALELAPRQGQAAPRAGVQGVALSSGARETHVLRFPRPESEGSGDTRCVVALPAGLLPAEGTLGLTERAELGFTLSRDFDVIGHQVVHGAEADTATVSVRFDRALSSRQEAPPVTVEPPVTPLFAHVSGHELVLEGGFRPRNAYTVVVGPSLLAEDGSTLGRERRVVADVPRRWPALRLEHPRGVLTPTGGLTMPLVATNVASVHVEAAEVLPGNLVPHLRGERERYTSRRIVSRTFELPSTPDRPTRHALDLRALFGDSTDGMRGVYALSVRSAEDYWITATGLVRITDLVVTVKQDATGAHAWVQSIATGAPVAGATLCALTVTEQLVASARTDAAGYAALPVPASDGEGDVYVVTAERDGDLAYTLVDGHAWNVPRELAEGRAAPRHADVFVYAERRLYRPGDTAHLTGLVRTPAGATLSRELRVRVERPDGLVALSTDVRPDLAHGAFHVDVTTERDARTGVWQVEVVLPAAPGGPDEDLVVGRTRFEVEAFLAARLVIQAEPKAAPAPGEGATPRLEASVRSLAGTSVAGYPVRAVARWTPVGFTSERHAGFRFGTLTAPRDESRVEWAGALDAAGRAAVTAPGAETLAPGRWRGRIDWTVTEPGGRSVSTRDTVELDRPAMHLGLVLGDEGDPRVLDAGEGAALIAVGGAAAPTLPVRWLTVDAAGAAAPAPRLGYELAAVRREPRLVDLGGALAWRMEEHLDVVATGVVTPGGDPSVTQGTFEIPAVVSGELRLVVRDAQGASHTIALHGVDGDLASFRPPLESLEEVVLRPLVSVARPGDVLEVDVQTPFDGSLLVTLEDDRLRSQQRLDVVGGTARVTVTLPHDLRGGAFLSAQVTRPLERRAAWRPHRAYGWTRVATTHEDHRLTPRIEAPQRVRPGALATVVVSAPVEATSRPIGVHLYAVDEGIRVTGGDRLPDPVAHFFGARRHATPTTDGWAELMPDEVLPEEVRLIGGDGDLDTGDARRRAPEEVRRVPGVVWQTWTELGADGRRTFELAVPDLVGTLTWIAVVADGDRYGSASAPTVVRGDLPLQASWPRFAAPGDRLLVPVAYENPAALGATPADVALTLELAGPVRFVGERPAPGTRPEPGLVEASAPRGAAPEPDDPAWTIEGDPRSSGGWRAVRAVEAVPPGAVVRRWVELEVLADSGLGDGARALGAVSLEGAFADGRGVLETADVDLPIRSGRPLVVAGFVRRLAAGGEAQLDLAAELGLDPDEPTRAAVQVSSSFGEALAPLARYVLGYPYGCAEQTASRVLALLAWPRGAFPLEGLQDAAATDAAIDARVRAGIDRLWSMQAAYGGVAYWPGQREASPWASTYVAEVLAAADAAGYDVPEDLTQRLATYLEQLLARDHVAESRATLVRVLAALGRPQPGWWRRLMEEPERQSRAGLIELASAAVLAGATDDARRALALAAARTSDEPLVAGDRVGRPWAALRLCSRARALALELETRLALDGPEAEVTALLTALEAERRAEGGARFGSTLDDATALRALARYHAAVAARPAAWRGVLLAAGAATPVDSSAVARAEAEGAAAWSLWTEGEGSVWVRASVAGRRAADAPATDAGLVVRRRWLDESGAEVDPGAIPLGALVTVEVRLATDGRPYVPDVAIVDAIPAGFEVENPRLANTTPDDAPGQRAAPGVPPGPDPMEPDRVEFLDDRVLLFTGARQEPAVARYRLRAVALGSFERAPVHAEAMYEPAVSSVGGPTGRVTVVAP